MPLIHPCGPSLHLQVWSSPSSSLFNNNLHHDINCDGKYIRGILLRIALELPTFTSAPSHLRYPLTLVTSSCRPVSPSRLEAMERAARQEPAQAHLRHTPAPHEHRNKRHPRPQALPVHDLVMIVGPACSVSPSCLDPGRYSVLTTIQAHRSRSKNTLLSTLEIPMDPLVW